MNNENDDILRVYNEKLLKKIQMELERDLWGMTKWGVMDKQPECVVCHKTYHAYEDGDVEPYIHPFLRNNLEYLEWEDERRRRS